MFSMMFAMNSQIGNNDQKVCAHYKIIDNRGTHFGHVSQSFPKCGKIKIGGNFVNENEKREKCALWKANIYGS